jgi:transcriptional regulator with XRE-family HTH domain
MTLKEAAETLEKDGVKKTVKLLRSARLGAKLNRLQLAKLSGVPQSNIHRIEHGKQSLTPRVYAKLYDAIEDQFYRNAQEKRYREKVAELSRKYGQLPERELLTLAEAELDKTRRARIQEFFERTHIGDRASAQPPDLPALPLETLTELITYKFTTDPDFGPAFSQEYQKFFAKHPALPHLTKDQCREIRERLARDREHEADRKRQFEALEKHLASLGMGVLEHPTVKEFFDSFRRELADKDRAIEDISRELAKAQDSND